MRTKQILFCLFFIGLLLCQTNNMKAQVTIGAEQAPKSFSVLELISNQKSGLRMPQMTTTQRNTMTTTGDFQGVKTTLAKGLTIYNTDTDCLESWSGTRWISMCTGDAIESMTGNTPNKDYTAGKTDPATTITSLTCTETTGSWTFTVTQGSEYASISDENTTTGTFKVLWKENTAATSRSAIVTVTDKCGNKQAFTFIQTGMDITFYPTYNTYNDTFNELYLDAILATGTSDNITRGTGVAYSNVSAGYFKYSDNVGVSSIPNDIVVTHESGLKATVNAQTLSSSGSLEVIISGTPSATYAGKAFDIPITILGKKLTVRIHIGCGAYMGSKFLTDNIGVAVNWKQFKCFNSGVTVTSSLNPFTPQKEIHGAKYRFGASAASYSQANDQSNSGAIVGWTGTDNMSSAPYMVQTDGDYWFMATDPCVRMGWRLPTQEEWVLVVSNNTVSYIGTWNNAASNYSSGIYLGRGLFLPTAGQRSNLDGALIKRGQEGYYWSNTGRSGSTNNDSHALYFEDSYLSGFFSYSRHYGNSVRCIAE